MPATDPFSRASRASKGFVTWAGGAASKQSVGLAGLPGFFLLVLALVRRIRLLFNAGASACLSFHRIGGSSPPPTCSGNDGWAWAAAGALTARHFRRIRPVE